MSNFKRTSKLGALLLGTVLTLSACALLEAPDPHPPLNSFKGGEDCALARVVASSEKAELLAGMADSFNQSEEDEDCTRVLVYTQPSGKVMSALARGWDEEKDGPRPDVWSPASTSWLKLLEEESVDKGNASPVNVNAPSIANTPLVIAMPRPMAESLGWPETPLGWSDVLDLSTNPDGWGSVGHPEWGAFKLGKTNPNFSTSGLNATIGTYFAATGLSSDLSVSDVQEEEVLDYVSSIESSVVHYGDTTLTFLSNMRKAADKGGDLSYVSAVTLEEKSVWDYNQGNPTGNPKTLGDQNPPNVPLVALYPKEGTLMSDNPYAILEGDEVSKDSRRAAEEFLTFVQTPAMQERFMEAGFRDFEGNPGKHATLENGLSPSAPTLLAPPSSSVLSEILSSWSDVRKGARVLLLVDTSGSMRGTKIDNARAAIDSSLNLFSEHDQVSLVEFNSDYQSITPMENFNKDKLSQEVKDLGVGGGTALYSSILESLKKMEDLPEAETIDAIVVLSDGENTEDGDLQDVIDHYSTSEGDKVRIFTIGYGQDADQEALQKIADASGGAAYNASNPESIESVMAAVISNF